MTRVKSEFIRPCADALTRRMREPRQFINVVLGARQTGKTTLVRQVTDRLDAIVHAASADNPTLRGHSWIETQWELARALAREDGRAKGAVLVLDEIQKVPDWSDIVKRLWDEDSAARLPLRVVLLGSAPLLVQRGLTESLAGRFEILHVPHWSFAEMRDAFGWNLQQYIFYGGYPGAAQLIAEPARWARYIVDSLIETAISRDVLLLSRIDKPALLRRLFHLGCLHSGQVLSYTKMLGQLQESGNATTLAHYLDLLAGAGMITGLQKYAGAVVRRRGSIPKLQVYNAALISAQSGFSFEEAMTDTAWWGRLVESCVGAHLANAAASGACELFYWRENNAEVDFVARVGRTLTSIEVKSGNPRSALSGMAAFAEAFRPRRSLIVGTGGIPVERFLSSSVESWITR